ncbi:YVTN family beta-propeller repeat protein [Terrabacter sp. 2RAF25]|uniref:YVTN family beta-propeller repeat protein n=1 Tax=Terrabacter sp. 2RAF25 TaxID=3232998 RepID=UPI003F975064
MTATRQAVPTRRSLRRIALAPALLITLAVLAACTQADAGIPGAATDPAGTGTSRPAIVEPSPRPTTGPGAPKVLPTQPGPYAYVVAGALSAEARRARPLVYVPNQLAGTVQVIDPRTYAVIATTRVAASPEHVVPSHDLRTLWVNSDKGNSMLPIDPRTGRPGPARPVLDPYNLYFTPDGRYALVMAERLKRIDVRDAHTMALRRSLPIPCHGINHADYTQDLSTLLVSCEFSGKLAVVDASATRLLRMIDLNAIATPGATPPAMARHMGGPAAMLDPGSSAMPQDVRLSPDGRWLLAADMLRNGVWVVDAHTFRVVRFVPTGRGAHSIYLSRDSLRVYVGNRDEGTVSVLDGATLRPVATWRIPGGGSPDMGGVTADGRELWLSGRYDSVVYVFDTATGRVSHRIPVKPGPHGLLVWPQPGRFSLGHTGNMR